MLFNATGVEDTREKGGKKDGQDPRLSAEDLNIQRQKRRRSSSENWKRGREVGRKNKTGELISRFPRADSILRREK